MLPGGCSRPGGRGLVPVASSARRDRPEAREVHEGDELAGGETAASRGHPQGPGRRGEAAEHLRGFRAPARGRLAEARRLGGEPLAGRNRADPRGGEGRGGRVRGRPEDPHDEDEGGQGSRVAILPGRGAAASVEVECDVPGDLEAAEVRHPGREVVEGQAGGSRDRGVHARLRGRGGEGRDPYDAPRRRAAVGRPRADHGRRGECRAGQGDRDSECVGGREAQRYRLREGLAHVAAGPGAGGPGQGGRDEGDDPGAARAADVRHHPLPGAGET
mmetsp:Transcript_66904/g.193344  ORF Transcript_66904/g.193344 Transcript_66904/m.193344 type:complete len:274 (+) Transcript_66904:2039-2860(+)